jgi:homoaconitate hydratase
MEIPFTNAPTEKKKTPQTLTEKIVQHHAVGLPVSRRESSFGAATTYRSSPTAHDNTSPIPKKFVSIGATRVKDSRQIVFALGHDVQNKSESNLKKYEQIEAFAKKHSVVSSPPTTRGHQVMVSVPTARKADCRMLTPRQVEELFVWLGKLRVAAVVRTDAASKGLSQPV